MVFVYNRSKISSCLHYSLFTNKVLVFIHSSLISTYSISLGQILHIQGRRRLLESGTAIEHCWCSPGADGTRGGEDEGT